MSKIGRIWSGGVDVGLERDDRVGRVVAMREGQANVRVDQVLEFEQLVTERVVQQPNGRAAAGEMDLQVEHAALDDEFLERRQDLVDVFVEAALDPALLEHVAADRRVALELTPAGRLRVQFLGDRQAAQVEVATEVADELVVAVDTLDRRY